MSSESVPPEAFLRFVELDEFADDWEAIGLDREIALWDLQNQIMSNPNVGKVVSGAGGLRKMPCGSTDWKTWRLARLLCAFSRTCHRLTRSGLRQERKGRLNGSGEESHSQIHRKYSVVARTFQKVRVSRMGRQRRQKRIGQRIVERLRNFADALESGDDISKRFTCHTIQLNLIDKPYSPRLVKTTRDTLGVSQAIFAQFLGVSASAVQDWEQGAKRPHGSARRLMDEIRDNPEYWRRRLRELAMPVGT
jgi:putative transcriptional regulator